MGGGIAFHQGDGAGKQGPVAGLDPPDIIGRCEFPASGAGRLPLAGRTGRGYDADREFRTGVGR
jgi:hypothetical protein